MARFAQFAHELRARARLGEAEAVVVQLGQAPEELIAAGARREPDADPPASLAAGLLRVRRVGRDRDLVAGAEHVQLAVQLHLHRAFEDGVVLGDADVHVPDGDEALGGADHVDLGVGTVRRLARSQEHHPHTQFRHIDDIAWLRHFNPLYARAYDRLCTLRTDLDHCRGTGFAPSAEALIQVDAGIAGARLGATRDQVRAALGKPIKIRTLKNDFGPYVEYRFSGGIRVTFQGKTNVLP